MPFVISQGQLQGIHRYTGAVPGIERIEQHALSESLSHDYAMIWRSQPQIRTVVSFLARNIAQLGIHVFRRVSDVDRERDADHPLARLLSQPNPTTTRYRWIEALVSDLALYDNAVLAKITTARQPRALLRLDPRSVTPIGDNPYGADYYRVSGNLGTKDLRADQVVHFRGYNPTDIRWGASPIETLRRILYEEHQAVRYREQLWRNGARMSGYLQRPVEAPEWSTADKERFRTQWQAQYTGDGPQAGGTPILEDGMEFNAVAVTPESAQYIESRKLTREEVASAYHIPLPMVGILEHATYSNITEQHKQLYQDTLGPWLEMITQELHLQLLPDFADTANVYCEFNLAEKLRGSFEEQASQLQVSVGAPWMTRNEARARMNLPQLDGGDSLITPLNVITGESEADDEDEETVDEGEPAGGAQETAGRRLHVAAHSVLTKARPGASYEQQATEVFTNHFKRQRKAVQSAIGAQKSGLSKASTQDVLDEERWTSELAADLFRLDLLIAAAAGRSTMALLGYSPNAYDEDRTTGWHAVAARSIASDVTSLTALHLSTALDEQDQLGAVKNLYDTYLAHRVGELAVSQVTNMSGFATTEAAAQTGQSAQKTWRVTSRNPRPEHQAINGETVDLDDTFSNGGKWPGDSALGDDQRAGCQCDMDIVFP